MKRLIILLLISLLGCTQIDKKNHHMDSYYSDKGGFDLSRFPLIKPYEISIVIPSNDWIVSSIDTAEVPQPIPGTRYVNVIDSVIFIYSIKTTLNYQPINKAWFVIIPKKHVFKGFKNQSEYIKYLSSIRIKKPKMYEVGQVFHYFDRNDTLDWKKLNQSQ